MVVREHYSHVKANRHQEKKRDEAKVRQEFRTGRSDEEQIAKLDSGHHVAAKERARLQSRINIKKRIKKR